jgi:hypothetical protein
MKNLSTFEEFLNEQEEALNEGNWGYSVNGDGTILLSTLKPWEAERIEKELKSYGWDAWVKISRGEYYGGYVYINPPKDVKSIVDLALSIEKALKSDLVDGSTGKRVAVQKKF